MGLFSVLNVGTRGMSASQLGMDITGQNISNADVEGYSRKRLTMAADYRYDPVYGQMGFGVEVINIERVRNVYIDQQIRRQNREVGCYEEIDHTLEAIENMFAEPGDTGIMAYIDQFFDSWENLCDNPADMSARTMVKTNGEILTGIFHNLTSELRDLQQTRNDEIADRVNQVNEICKEIFNLNKEIAAVEISDQNANDSRDRRDLLCKKLAKIIEIDTIENDLGQITITTSGNIIVSPVDVQELELTSATFTRADGSNYSNVGIRFKDSKRIYYPTGGQIKGLMDSRDIIIPEYESKLDTLALGLTEKVNAQHVLGYNLMGYNGFKFFDPQTTGASDIALSASIISDIKNIAAALAETSQSATTITTTAGELDYGNPPQQLSKHLGRLWVSTDSTDERVRNIVNGSVIVSVAGTTLVEDTDYHIDYVSGTIQMLHTGYDSNAVTIDFDYNTGDFAGPGDNANAIEISKLRHELTMSPDALGNATASFDEYYSSIIGTLGLDRNEAASNLETRQFLVEQYETQQDSIAGVSLDEEMTELIKFQHTYQACAQIITTTNKMLDVLMSM